MQPAIGSQPQIVLDVLTGVTPSGFAEYCDRYNSVYDSSDPTSAANLVATADSVGLVHHLRVVLAGQIVAALAVVEYPGSSPDLRAAFASSLCYLKEAQHSAPRVQCNSPSLHSGSMVNGSGEAQNLGGN